MSDTARMLDETTDRLLARHLADADRTDEATRTGLLEAAREAGLPLALAPENRDGLGASLAEAGVIAWRWGYHAAPLPIAEMLLAGALAAEAGAGSAGGTYALSATMGTKVSGGGLIGGRIEAPAAPGNDVVLAVARDETGALVLAELDPAGAETFHLLSGEPWLRLGRSAPVRCVHRLDGTDADAVASKGAMLVAAAIVGAMSRVLEIAIEHVNTRNQFGRPLAKFQAIQHRIAEAASEHVVAQAALAGAVEALDSGDARPLAWLAAKAQAGHAAGVVAAMGHQMLGAIGFTEEHELHHYTKRLWGWRDEWGRQSVCEAEIGRAACAAPNGLWSHIVDDRAPR